jgi:hypothetical protein
MTTVIRIGDKVTWQPPARGKVTPMRLTGCKVLSLYDIDGRAAAILDCGFFGEVNAFVANLEPEEADKTTILSGG